MLSLAYWTIVGTYIFEGEKNDTSTMMDTVVFDIRSRKMLFRAPGTSKVKGAGTPVNIDEELRRDSQTGFVLAAEKMVVNLQAQLDIFKENVKDSSKYQVVNKPGYTGAGDMGWLYASGVLMILGLLVCLEKRKNA